MKKETDFPHDSYSIDEILAETKMKKETEVNSEKPTETPKVPSSDAIARDAMNALKMETAGEPKSSPKREEARAEKKKKRSFFHRRKRDEEEEDDSIPEDDIYYGLQLKSLEEYKREYEETISIDTKMVNEAEESLRRKHRAINEAVWGNENGPAKDQEPSAETEQTKPEQIVLPESDVKQEPEQKLEPKKAPDLDKILEPEQATPEQTVRWEPAAKQEPEQKPEPQKAPDLDKILEPEQAKPEQAVRWKPAAEQEPEQKPEPQKAPDLDKILEPEQAKPEQAVRWEPAAEQELEKKPEPEKAPDLDKILEPEQAMPQQTVRWEPAAKQEPEQKPEPPLKTETAAPEGVSPKSHAVAVKKAQTTDRAEWLERIFRHAGLDEETILDTEDSAAGPEFPTERPQPPLHPVAPPVLPTIQPGPPLEPEQEPPIEEPPIQEPPLQPSPSPTGETIESVPSEVSWPEDANVSEPIESSIESPTEGPSPMPTGEKMEPIPAEVSVPEDATIPEPIESSIENSTEESSSIPTGEEMKPIPPEVSSPEDTTVSEPIESSVETSADESSCVPASEKMEPIPAEVSSPQDTTVPEPMESSAENSAEESSPMPTGTEMEPLPSEVSWPEDTTVPEPIENFAENSAEESFSVPTGEEMEPITTEVLSPEDTNVSEPIESSTENSTEESSPMPTGEEMELIPTEVSSPEDINVSEPMESSTENSAEESSPMPTDTEMEQLPPEVSTPEPIESSIETPAEEPYPTPIGEGTELPPEEPLKVDAAPAEYLTAQEEIPAPVKEPEARPQQKKETPLPPAAKEPPKKNFPRYRSVSLPLEVIDLGAFDDALAAEATGYSVEPAPVPEPISFPVFEKKESAPAAKAEKAETEDAVPQEPDLDDFPIKFGKIRAVPTPKQLPQTKKPKKHFRFFGSDEDPTPPDEPVEEPQEELEDYNHPADAPAVLNDLQTNVRKLFLRFLVTLFFSLILAGFTAAWEHPALLPAQIHNVYTAQNFMIVQLIFLTAAAAFCGPTIRSGFSGLFRLQGNSDSAVAVAVIAAWVQNIVSLFAGAPAGGRLYASLAALALFFNTAGKLSISKRILRNFRFITSPKEKYAVQMYDDYNTAIQMSKTLTAEGPKIAYQTKTEFLSHFLKHSYASDPSEHISQFLAPAGFLGSIALLIVSAVLTKNSLMALAAFTAGTCLSVPFGAALSVSLPLARLHKIAARCGGMAVGWDAVEQFSATDAVLIDAQDLFPRGTVILNGIQTFAGQRIDEAILDATALTAAVGGTLSDLFSQIVKSRGDILPHVERPVYEEGLGISGMVSDRVILVGTGELLRRHGLEPPSRDYEEKYRRGGKIPVYLASGGVLVAMFLVFYRSDRRRAAELRRVESNGITLLVRSRDPNLTSELISDCFGLSIHSVNILSEHLGEVYDSLQKNPPKRAPAVLATKGRAAAMMRMLTACARQRGNIMIGVALQTAGAALGFALAAFFTAYSGLSQLSATSLLAFEAFWAAAVIFIPKIRKP